MTSTRIQRATIAACFRDAYADLSPQTASARDTYRALGLRAGRECHTRIVRLRRSMSGLADAAHTVRQIGVRAAPALRRARRASAQVLSSARTFRRATISALTHCAPGGPADTAQDAMTV